MHHGSNTRIIAQRGAQPIPTLLINKGLYLNLVPLDSVPVWWHSIDLGQGVVTNGHATPEILAGELDALRLPNLRGRTVLDINTWDGFYAFEAECRGAVSVTALDLFVWSIDLV